MKIAIFETDHFEGSYPVIKLFDNNKNDITIFTYSPAYKQFQYLFSAAPTKYTWIVKPDKTSKYTFIRAMFREIRKRKIAVVYLNTISDNFFFYALMIFLLCNTRVIVTMHSVNSYFEYKKSFSLRRIIRYIGRKMLVSVVKEFNVVGMTMVKHLENKLPPGKKVYCVPGAVFEEGSCIQARPAAGDHITIVIPGSIDDRRRNYEPAFTLLHLSEQSKIPVSITFLGRFYSDYGKRILEKCKAMQLEYTRLNYYEDDTVGQPEFDRVINEASFVFIPSVINTVIEDGVTDVYGTSICSGNLFDIIKHAKPFIIPEQLKIDPFLESSCFRYRTAEDIAAFISLIHKNPESYLVLQQKALEASRNYTIEKVRERNATLFNA
jgi:hypothetical protein